MAVADVECSNNRDSESATHVMFIVTKRTSMDTTKVLSLAACLLFLPLLRVRLCPGSIFSSPLSPISLVNVVDTTSSVFRLLKSLQA